MSTTHEAATRLGRPAGRRGCSRPHVSVVAGALCLSMSAILVKVADVDPATTAVLRCALATIALVPLALIERRCHGTLPARSTWWSLGAGIALGVDYAAWTASIYDVGAGVSTVLINMQVIVLPALALLIDREAIPRRFLTATPVLLVGVVLVGGVGSMEDAGGGEAASGTLLGLLAGTCYGAYLYLTRRASRGQHALLLQPLAVATVAAAVTAAVLSPISGGLSFATISVTSWALLALLAVVGQVLSWLLVHSGSSRLPATTTSGLLLVQPIFALGLGAALLGEHPSGLQIAGAVLVVAGVAVANHVLRLPNRSHVRNSRPRSRSAG